MPREEQRHRSQFTWLENALVQKRDKFYFEGLNPWFFSQVDNFDFIVVQGDKVYRNSQELSETVPLLTFFSSPDGQEATALALTTGELLAVDAAILHTLHCAYKGIKEPGRTWSSTCSYCILNLRPVGAWQVNDSEITEVMDSLIRFMTWRVQHQIYTTQELPVAERFLEAMRLEIPFLRKIDADREALTAEMEELAWEAEDDPEDVEET